ncbi:MAG: M28 family peptidase [Nitrospinota bacterium]|nr:MAG: M28 family peptidase [Nitrospinota bacterium]
MRRRENPYLNYDQQMLGDIYTAGEAMDNLITLCDDFGSRFGGTEGERQAVAFLREKFTGYGLSNAHLEPYTYNGWIRGEACLEILEPIQRTIPCISLPYSPPAQIQGKLLYLREGGPDDFARQHDQIRGKIVMVTSKNPPQLSRWVHRSEKYNRSVVAGAVGFIFMNHYPGLGPATGSIAGNREALIPGISVSKEWGEFLVRLAERKGEVTLRITTTDKTEPMQSWNVVAELPGQRYPDELVIIGSHYDGHDISQGAEDPASGMVVVLEAARVLAKYAREALDRTVRFIGFGNEEIGLIGAREYVKAHQDELSRIRFMLNLDSAGGRKRKGIVLNQWPELEPLLQEVAAEMVAEMPIGQQTSAFSDHFPFFLEGVPTGMMGDAETPREGRGFGHTAFDTVDKVLLSNLREAAANVCRVVLRIANHAAWPVKRRSPEQVRTLLESDANLEIMRLREAVEKLYQERGK